MKETEDRDRLNKTVRHNFALTRQKIQEGYQYTTLTKNNCKYLWTTVCDILRHFLVYAPGRSRLIRSYLTL